MNHDVACLGAWFEIGNSLPLAEGFVLYETAVVPDVSARQGEIPATTPIPMDGSSCYDPRRPSGCLRQLEFYPRCPGRGPTVSHRRHGKVIHGCIAASEVPVHGGHHSSRYHPNGGNDLPEAGIHQPCLLPTQGDAGRLFAAAVPHTLILTADIAIDEYRRPAVGEER